ncbi:MAG: hypothetical protein QOF03_309, partial [Alphaproteobacteria bacterium]|nr:hypothetical protein [Alphaproteobacteria bacterium]
MTSDDSYLCKVGRSDESDGRLAPAVDAQVIGGADKVSVFAVTEEPQAKMHLPSDPPTIFLGGLFILAAFAALHAASAIILPV